MNESFLEKLIEMVLEKELLKPQLRKFPFKTQVFDRYSCVEKALRNAVLESYIQGVSTRRVKEIVNALSGEEISSTT